MKPETKVKIHLMANCEFPITINYINIERHKQLCNSPIGFPSVINLTKKHRRKTTTCNHLNI